MRSWLGVICAVAACGDDIVPIGPPIEQADRLFVVAHSDDDLIFMQPELLDALAESSVTTIYVATGDPVKGLEQARFLQGAARVAYAKAADIDSWECGYVELAASTVHHCRATNRPVSLIALDITDGGVPGERRESMLHLVDGTIESLPVRGAVGGSVTVESATELVAELLALIAPAEIHALELAGTHGRDHSSHMFSSAFTLWGAARVGFAGPLTWHRGYNVAELPITFDGAAHDAAKTMLGYYEACATDCGECGTSCTTFTSAHAWWLQRQYDTARVLETTGRLVGADGCVTSALGMGACGDADALQLTRDGQLRVGDACVASTPDSGVVWVPCGRDPAQYWVLDTDGMLWNGTAPAPAADMSYNHVRCLSSDGGVAGVATCGELYRPTWRFEPL